VHGITGIIMNVRIFVGILIIIASLFFGMTNCKKISICQEYQSVSNGIADLNIKLNDDSSFKFSMKILASDQDPEEQLHFTGAWNEDSNYYNLMFKENRPDLKALFDLNYAESDEFKIVNDSTISINKNKKVIMIWGIACEKLK
jgi:hypothetical protein